MNLRPQVVALLVALVVAMVAMVGYIAYRQVENDGRCAAILGSGATWSGGSRCVPPPITVGGLL